MFANLRQDFGRCGRSFPARFREVLTNPAMWAVFGYRARRWVAASLPRPLRWLFAPFLILTQLVLELLTHVQLPTRSDIGGGLYLPHLGPIVIGSGAVIGKNCTLAHNVTIGHGGGGRQPAAANPTVGDRVYVGPAVVIIGPVTVGDDALVGAGSVVVKAVPARGVVAGNPARLLSRKGSFALIEYPDMQSDQARRAAIAATDAEAQA